MPKTAGKAALAMESFARALRQLPSIIADNAGFDSSDLITKLRAAHAAGDKTAGLDMKEGKVGDMWALGIREVTTRDRAIFLQNLCKKSTSRIDFGENNHIQDLCKTSNFTYIFALTGVLTPLQLIQAYKSKLQVLISAAEAAEMILRVDDIIKCAPRERQGQ